MLARLLGCLGLLAAVSSLPGCGGGDAPEARRGRVLVIGIDGAAPRLVDPLMAQGRLPHLAGLAADGVYGKLRSAKPIDSPRIWNTIVTGKVPDKHGIQHFARTDEDGGKVLYLSSDRRVHALWNIVSDAGMKVGVVNFWNTYPPELVDGVMVSDHLIARDIQGRRRITKAKEVPLGPVIHPASWNERVSRVLERDERLTDIENPLRDNPNLPRWLVLVGNDLPRHFAEDGALTRIAREIDREVHPDLLMVLLTGIDRTSHFLWGSLEDPEIYQKELRLGPAEREGGTAALERYYEYTDALIGVLLEGWGPDDLVVVLSDHGFEPGVGMGLLTGVHETDAAIDGVFFARGRGIAVGAPTGELSITDVTPTILSWMGLPVGEDMDGRVAAFLENPSGATIPSHDGTPVRRMELRPSGAEEKIIEQLESLGYLE